MDFYLNYSSIFIGFWGFRSRLGDIDRNFLDRLTAEITTPRQTRRRNRFRVWRTSSSGTYGRGICGWIDRWIQVPLPMTNSRTQAMGCIQSSPKHLKILFFETNLHNFETKKLFFEIYKPGITTIVAPETPDLAGTPYLKANLPE